jgi:hypothetical protein
LAIVFSVLSSYLGSFAAVFSNVLFSIVDLSQMGKQVWAAPIFVI